MSDEIDETIVHVERRDDGSVWVDLDDLALLLRKRGRQWMDRSEYSAAEREYVFSLLDHAVNEAISTVKQYANELNDES